MLDFLDIFSLNILIGFMLTKRQVFSLLIVRFFTSGQYAFWSNLSLTLQAEKCKIQTVHRWNKKQFPVLINDIISFF